LFFFGGGVDPSKENLGKLVRIKKQIEKKFGIWLEVLSGGSSGSIPIMQCGEMPIEINQLRIGSAISIGNGLHGVKLEGTYNDCFILKAEIIEIKMKPSVPIGNRGTNAFGRIVKFEDRGIIKRAICALGKQDVDEEYIMLVDNKIKVLGSSSDHLILDISDTGNSYNTGDTVAFKLKYGGILCAMTSSYIKKVYIQ